MQVYHVHGEGASPSMGDSKLCTNGSALNVLQNDESAFHKLMWIGREKIIKAHSAPLIERRGNEEDDDESFSFRTRLSPCISSMFSSLVSCDALRLVPALPGDGLNGLSATGRHILLQVFRI